MMMQRKCWKMSMTTAALLVVSSIALVALLAASAQAELVWPKEWVAFGPVEPDKSMAGGGPPDRASLVSGEMLRTIPKELVIRGQRFSGQKVLLEENRIDLGRWFGGVRRGWTVYLLAPVKAEADMKMQIGTGADWWMQWWLDGQPIYDTLSGGNVVAPIAITNHVFKVSLTKGEHVLAAAVIGGSNSFVFAAGGPEELRAGKPGKKSPAEIRAEAARALADEKAGPYDQANAQLAIARSYLEEENYPAARAEYTKVLTGPQAQVTLYQDPRSEAALELAVLGKPAVEPLIAALGHKEPEVRCLAAWALGEIGEARAVAPLLALLKDQERVVQVTAHSALIAIGVPAAEALIGRLKDTDKRVRVYAATALGEIRDRRAVEPLIGALQDKDWEVRRQAAAALGEIKDPQAVKPLVTTLPDNDWRVRDFVQSALTEIGGPAVEPLIASLRDESGLVRARAAETLGKIKDVRAAEPLLAILNDSERVVQVVARDALVQIGVPAVKPLINALKHRDSLVRAHAAAALGEIKDHRAVEPVLAALKDQDAGVRRSAAAALESLQDRRAVTSLLAALKDEDAEVRKAAAEALGGLGDPGAVEALLAALGDVDNTVRTGAARALGRLKDRRAVEPLIGALKDEDWEVRRQAATALGKIKDPRAVGPLVPLTTDSAVEVRIAARAALKEITDENVGLWEWKAWWENNKGKYQ